MSGPDPSQNADYNPIFEKLVDEAGPGTATIRGLVAYGIYKNSKREWALNIRQTKGRPPTKDELADYIATWTPSQLQHMRQSADQLLALYAKQVIETEEPKILARALHGSFGRDVWRGIVAAALYTLILIAFAIILAYAGVNFVGIFRSASPPA